MNPDTLAFDVDACARAGEKIYADKYKSQYEHDFSDQFAAIDITTERAFVGEFPEVAIEQALEARRGAKVHLVRIGSPSAVEVSFVLGLDHADLARAN